MEEIGLFPLPMVLLPTERVPLHVFEDRYQELIGECLEEDRELGLVLEDDDGLREVGTRAAVIEVLERFPDGRLNVVVEGRERFRLAEETAGRAFRTALVEPVLDEAGEPSNEEVAKAVGALRGVAELAGASLEGLEIASATPSFELAARVELEPALKQRLLELRSESERLRMLASVLRQVAASLAARRERAEIASRNGRPAQA